jgi:hypothetical protein
LSSEFFLPTRLPYVETESAGCAMGEGRGRGRGYHLRLEVGAGLLGMPAILDDTLEVGHCGGGKMHERAAVEVEGDRWRCTVGEVAQMSSVGLRRRDSMSSRWRMEGMNGKKHRQGEMER